jgi:predicted P-loop ATPase
MTSQRCTSIQKGVPLTDVLSSALSLAARGWYIFPVQIGDKAPLAGTAGYKDATTDAAQIKSWWHERPTANVAVAAGLSGLLVLDIDPRSGGELSLTSLIEKHGPLPATFSVKTQGGGTHFYFKSTPVRSRSGILPGVDVKSHGGYVVGPGSRTEKGTYEIITDVPLADAPTWLVELCEPPRDSNSTPSGDVLDGMLGLAFEHAGLLGQDHGPGMRLALCPFRKEHSTGSDFDTSTVIFAPDLKQGHVRGWIDCKHRCSSRDQSDFWNALPAESRRYAELKHIERAVETGAATGSAPVRDWSDTLRRGQAGEVLKTDDNAIIILLNEPNWKGCLAYNAMTGAKEWRRPPPIANQALKAPELGPFRDTHVAIINAYLTRIHGWKETPKNRVFDIVDIVAEQNSFHPVRDYLSDLRWDGRPRVKDWLRTYCHATNSPEYLSLVGSWWLVSAVARAFVPGCDAQLVLILDGPQGVRKSTTFRILGGQWSRDTSLSFSDPVRAASALRGAWIYELPELASLAKADQEHVKAFISSPSDWFRGAYKREEQLVPRTTIFGGTVNPDKYRGNAYLKDPTGARRYLPVFVGGLIDTDALQRDRDQLWAETVIMYCNGAKWKPMTQHEVELIAKVQEQRSQVHEEDPMYERFLIWTEKRPHANLTDYSVEVHGGKLQHWEITALGTRLRSEGWTTAVVKNRRVWVNPNVTEKTYTGEDLDWSKGN